MATLTTGSRPATARSRHETIATGVAALVFAGLLVAQNLIRSAAPGFDATPHAVTAYALDHPVAQAVPLVLFPIGMAAVLTFAAGMRHLADIGRARFWGLLGGTAVVAIAGLFGVLNVLEIALSVDAQNLAAAPAVVGALWAVHAAAFGLNLAAIAIALVGLSRVALAHHLIPQAFGVVTLAGAACLFAASLTTLALVQGAPTLYLGFVGFIVWGLFLVITGIRLLISPPT